MTLFFCPTTFIMRTNLQIYRLFRNEFSVSLRLSRDFTGGRHKPAQLAILRSFSISLGDLYPTQTMLFKEYYRYLIRYYFPPVYRYRRPART